MMQIISTIITRFINFIEAVRIAFAQHNSYKSNSFFNQDWSSFGVEVIAAIISSAVTIISLFLTIKHESNKQKIERQLDREHLLEEKRLSAQPYLCYETADTPEGKSVLGISLDFNPAIRNDMKCIISIRNNGLGIAINPIIAKIVYGSEIFMQSYNNITLGVSDKAHAIFEFISKDNSIPIELVFCYYNIYRNLYAQTIILGMSVEYRPDRNKKRLVETSKNFIVSHEYPPEICNAKMRKYLQISDGY